MNYKDNKPADAGNNDKNVDRQRALRRIALPVALVGLWLVCGEPDECEEWVRIFLLAKAAGISLLITARRMAGL